MFETVFFYPISFGILLFALGVILCRSAIHSVLCLVAAMGLVAALFVLLKAFLVATILILVYAGAILVLFLFVVMLIDFRTTSLNWNGLSFSPWAAVAIGTAFFFQTLAVIRQISLPENRPAIQGTTEAVGQLLFRNAVLPFELTSFLLLAAVVSVVVLAKKDGTP